MDAVMERSMTIRELFLGFSSITARTHRKFRLKFEQYHEGIDSSQVSSFFSHVAYIRSK